VFMLLLTAAVADLFRVIVRGPVDANPEAE
jgi:hypothetical protein